jgi:magnesium transporter
VIATEARLVQDLAERLLVFHPETAGPVLAGFGAESLAAFLQSLPEDRLPAAAAVLSPEVLGDVLEKGGDDLAGLLGRKVDPETLARALGRLGAEAREERMARFPKAARKEIEEILAYPEGTAGALMKRNVVRCQARFTVAEALKKVREADNPYITDICLADAEGFLLGTLSLQQLALARDEARLSDLPASPPLAVQDVQSAESAIQLMQERKLTSIPVVDFENRLLGIIRSDVLVTLAQKESGDDLQTMFGAGRDEKGLSRATFAVRKRLPWLQINLATAFLASAVVGLFEDTIAKITALAVFLPVVAGQSGNSGSQALAVTMRALALREIRPAQWFRLVRKEALAGLINGLAVAVVTASVVYFWNRSAGLALVIGVSMVVSMVMAGIAGAVIPLGLKAAGQDPALSSTIILTTVTDIAGFLSFLGLATLLATALNLS